jgi:PPM family protein phosphatase
VQKAKSSLAWDAWGQSDPGKKRENNEDRIFCDSGNGIFIVADGMGGEAAGEVAAQQAVDFMKKRLREETGSPARRLREAIAGANNQIYRLAERNPDWRGMACVLTAAVIENETLHIGHVGDSRLYEVRANSIRKITPDHSPVGQKEDSGELTELEAMRHPRRNEVFRDVGSQMHKPDDPEFIEYLQIPFLNDAAYVICSDGLSDMLASRQILKVLSECSGTPKESVRKLIEEANTAGGKDNISVIVIEAENFAAAAKENREPEDASGIIHTRGLSFLRGRWAFLLYGILAGLLLARLWLKPVENQPVAPEQPDVRMPVVLQVAPGNPEYPTIASALKSAQPGDRIEIGDGEYEEAIRLKEGVELAARNPGKAILYIPRVLPDVDAAITADGIKNAGLTGVAVRAEAAASLPYGVRLSNSSVHVSNLEVSGASRAGILIDGQSGGLILASYVHENAGPGIVTAGAASPLMIGNLFYGNGMSRSRPFPGLYVTDNSNPEVKRNVFSGNGSEAIRVQKQELKDKMMDNLFAGKGGKTVTVERTRQ